MQSKKRYLVTSALPYANGPLHIGHLAGAYLSADVYVRYLRLLGKDVVWVCGSDEHGAAITVKAMKEGLTPREIIDKYDAMFRKAFDGMGIAFDIFHRTSEPIHYQTSQDFFRRLHQNGEFEVIENEQYFDEEKQQFLADRYIIGTCPVCSNPDAYGDQCEKCGSSLSPNDLKPPIRSTLSASNPVKKPTKHWFLKLDKYEGWLRRWITEGELENENDPKIVTKTHNPADWKNHVMGQCKSWLDGGLQPRAMTRDLDWGIPVPPEIDETGSKKLYVWLDAPIGYISATKQWAIDKGQPELWKDYWQKDDTALIHFIGKDNIVFHCLIFPALLREHGDYVLPVNVPANQFMNLEGRKISTSKNWAVWVHEYLEEFEGKQDVLRYNMIKNMPELQDSEFTWKRFQESNNNELVGNLANFINRVLVLTTKNFDGKIPAIADGVTVASSDNAAEKVAPSVELAKLQAGLERLGDFIEKFDFRNALQTLMDISTHGNQFLQFNEPWKTIKTDRNAAAAALNIGMQIVAALAVASQPFLPFTSARLVKMLNIKDLQNGDWASMMEKLRNGEPLITEGSTLGEAEHLFTRIADEVIDAQIKKLEMTDNQTTGGSQQAAVEEVETTPQYAPLADTITYDDFAKMDIRTGTVLTAEKMPKSDKLLKLSIDLGFETRTILSGIAKHFTPEEMVGKQVVVLANLAPRKMMGIESNGMVLMAENAEGKLGLVAPPEGWQNGCVVK
ncbi:MAG: methionine--tRNA ligase [Saprospiraceae bacterium]|nr:methionine--tRNA ligase [Saprospiraceae bacterium]